jgi:hypoxanthine phosphoribosyltransferase
MGVIHPLPTRPKRILLPARSIQSRVAELGREIARDFRGEPVCLVGVLTGAVVFLSDLIRHIDTPVEIDFVAASSYGEATHSSGEVRIIKDVSHALRDKHVLIVEDIIDTGLTLRYLMETFSARQPASLDCCVLLDKPARRVAEVPVKYLGFEIEDCFVVGYGLDYRGFYRNLPYISELDA